MHFIFNIPDASSTSRGLKRKHRDEADQDVQTSSSSSSGEGNPRKRYRTRACSRRAHDGVPDPAPPPKQMYEGYQADCQFYFPDADLIILSEGIMFAVHAEKMRAAGGFFELLLSSPDINAQAEDMLYDLPCIDVPLISTRQLRFLIAYVYEKMSVFPQTVGY